MNIRDNALPIIERSSRGSEPPPRYVQIEPVGQCNLKCQMCPVQFREDGPASGAPAFMPFETYERILGEFTSLEHLHLQGLGEPMLHPQFFEMVELAAGRGIRVTINTNLTVLNERRAQRCIDSGLQVIHVSMDAASAEIYESIREGSRLARVLRNLEVLSQACRRHTGTVPELKLVSVVMRQNLAELPDLVRLAQRFGMQSLFVQHLCHDFGEASLPARYYSLRDFVERETLLHVPRDVVESHFQQARETAAQLGIDLRLPRVVPQSHAAGTPGRERCDWPWRGMYVTYQGYLLPCCMIATPDRFQLGHVQDGPLEQLWNAEPYEDFRHALAAERPPDICSSCAIYRGVF